MTPGAYHLTIARLQSFEAKGLSSTEALNNSVDRGWTGVFEPDRPKGGSNHHGSNRTNYDRRDTSGNAETVRRFLDELAAQDDGPGAGSNLDLPAASGGDAGAQPVEERTGDVPGGAGGPEPGADRPSLFRAAMECKHFPVPASLRDFALKVDQIASEAREGKYFPN